MAQQTINIGTVADDETGDTARVGGGKINDNFTELYGAVRLANGLNGYTATLPRQTNTGVNVQVRDAKIEYVNQSFTGNFYADPVVAFGYNVSASSGVADASGGEKYSVGYYVEGDYAVNSGEGGTATSGTTTTQVTISGKTWGVNRFVNWTVYNVTRGASAQITANTATTLTHAAIAGQTTGDVIQIMRRDVEAYVGIYDTDTAVGCRPWMYTLDRGSLEVNKTAKVISTATNATDAVFTVPAGHNLSVGNYVRFESLTGGTWGTQLNNRSKRVKAVASTTQFSIETDSTSWGTLTGGNCYREPDISSVHRGDRDNGFEVRTPTFRGDAAPSGQSYPDGMMFRAISGGFDIAPGNGDGLNVQLLCTPSGSSNLYLQHQGVTAWRLGNASVSGTSQTFVGVNVFSNAGAEVQAAAFFQRTNGAWGGMQVGANGGIVDATLVIDPALSTTSSPVIKLRQQSGALAAAHTFAVYQNDWATLNWFVDGVGNHVPRATATAVGATDGFQYIPRISGAGVTVPTGTPANLTLGYANASPMLVSHNTSDNTYRIHVYINGGWRTATLT